MMAFWNIFAVQGDNLWFLLLSMVFIMVRKEPPYQLRRSRSFTEPSAKSITVRSRRKNYQKMQGKRRFRRRYVYLSLAADLLVLSDIALIGRTAAFINY